MNNVLPFPDAAERANRSFRRAMGAVAAAADRVVEKMATHRCSYAVLVLPAHGQSHEADVHVRRSSGACRLVARAIGVDAPEAPVGRGIVLVVSPAREACWVYARDLKERGALV